MRKNVSEYIHYGSNIFKPDYILKKDKYLRSDKPNGLWASPVNADWGWKDWCELEDFRTERLDDYFTFTTVPEAKILHLHSLSQAAPYMKISYRFQSIVGYNLDLDKIYKMFDGMELHISDDFCSFHDNNVFYTWDVDSICIWNPNIIQLKKGEA